MGYRAAGRIRQGPGGGSVPANRKEGVGYYVCIYKIGIMNCDGGSLIKSYFNLDPLAHLD